MSSWCIIAKVLIVLSYKIYFYGTSKEVSWIKSEEIFTVFKIYWFDDLRVCMKNDLFVLGKVFEQKLNPVLLDPRTWSFNSTVRPGHCKCKSFSTQMRKKPEVLYSNKSPHMILITSSLSWAYPKFPTISK